MYEIILEHPFVDRIIMIWQSSTKHHPHPSAPTHIIVNIFKKITYFPNY